MGNVVAVFGEAIVDLIQQQEGLYESKLGGSPLNVARAFAKQGATCNYLAPISTDYLGNRIYTDVINHGILVPKDNRSEKASSLAIVYLGPAGTPEYSLYRDGVADLDVTEDKLRESMPQSLDLFHTGSLALVPEMEGALIPIIKELKARSVKISIDVNFRFIQGVDHREHVSTIWRFIELADVVKVSDEDLSLMGLSEKPEQHAMKMLEVMTGGLVVLTFGEDGSRVISEDLNVFQNVSRPRDFVDTVGAGDTFFSVFLDQLLRQHNQMPLGNTLAPEKRARGEKHPAWGDEAVITRSLKYASVAAALNIEQAGCQPPTLQEIQDRIAT